MGAPRQMAQTRFLMDGRPVLLSCKHCEAMLKEVMTQDRVMAELKRDLRSLEVLINKKFGFELNLRYSRELRLRDRPSIEIRPYLHRQEKLKICVSPRAKFAKQRELLQKAQSGGSSSNSATPPEEHDNEEEQVTYTEHYMTFE